MFAAASQPNGLVAKEDQMVRRTRKEALETRNRILDTAVAIFGEKGVSRTSLADIADATGVTRGAIYWHFKNKGDLLNAMFERVALPMEEMVERSTDDAAADPMANVRNYAAALTYLRQRPVIFAVRRASFRPRFLICG